MDMNSTLSELGLDAEVVPEFIHLPLAQINYAHASYNDPQCSICKGLLDTTLALIFISFTSVSVFESVRVWSISGKNWLLASLVFALNMVAPCVDLYGNARPQQFAVVTSGPLAGCDAVPILTALLMTCALSAVGLIARAAAFISYMIVLGVTLYSSAAAWKARSIGIAQFLILSALNTVVLALDILSVLNPNVFLSQFISINEALTAILLCRFILDLRAIYPNDSPQDSTSQSNMSSVRFVKTVVGNVGAPLSGCSLFSSAADIDSQEDMPMYTDEPLQTLFLESLDNAESRHSLHEEDHTRAALDEADDSSADDIIPSPHVSELA
ncbi:hypothetical protein K474DRAFT_1671903 [Panus rudis PR-1116 ss-1]|nr:hypothetical protein K474DRAFT_1671903 [Panus rudis PR-1116 ss-1]